MYQASHCISPSGAGIEAETRIHVTYNLGRYCRIPGISWTECWEWGDWYPSLANVCKNKSVTQVRHCLRKHPRSWWPNARTRRVKGEKDCTEGAPPCRPRYSWGGWTPAKSEVCAGVDFTQRSVWNCTVQAGCRGGERCPAARVYRDGANRSAVGTYRGCQWENIYHYNPYPADWDCYEWGEWKPKAVAKEMCADRRVIQTRKCKSGRWIGTHLRTDLRTVTGTKDCA